MTLDLGGSSRALAMRQCRRNREQPHASTSRPCRIGMSIGLISRLVMPLMPQRGTRGEVASNPSRSSERRIRKQWSRLPIHRLTESGQLNRSSETSCPPPDKG